MAATADLPVEHAASAVPATRPAHCLTLPNEVLSMIASECAPADLKNMRLASKLMHQVATKPFARKKFSRRRFIFTYQSMKALVNITAHPVFGPHLTCLTFGTYRMKTATYLEIVGKNEDKHDDGTVQYDITEGMHRAFIECKHHIKMLSLALENLKECHNTRVILGVHDDIQFGAVRVRGYAFEASYRDFCPQVNDMSGTLRAVMLARDRSEYPLTALELSLTSESGGLTVLANFDLYSSVSTSHLDILLEIWSSDPRWNQKSPKLRILSNFTRFELSRHYLGREVNREYLMRFDSASYGVILQTIESKPLQAILLEDSEAEYDHLVQFLQKHKNSLRSLELDSLRIFDRRSTRWALKILRFLIFHLQLSYLSMRYLVVHQLFIVREPVPLVCKGRNEVEKRLDEIIIKVEEIRQEERQTGRKGFRFV
ncbi:hypothetical protein KCU93_g5814, partial [Aureobasidium melanogenum]